MPPGPCAARPPPHPGGPRWPPSHRPPSHRSRAPTHACGLQAAGRELSTTFHHHAGGGKWRQAVWCAESHCDVFQASWRPRASSAAAHPSARTPWCALLRYSADTAFLAAKEAEGGPASAQSPGLARAHGRPNTHTARPAVPAWEPPDKLHLDCETDSAVSVAHCSSPLCAIINIGVATLIALEAARITP